MIPHLKEALIQLEICSKKKPLKIISHYDTDGITSAVIFAKAMQRLHKSFSLQIVKNLEKEFIESLPEDNVLVFLDLASNSLPYLAKKKTEVFIFDHHEVDQAIPENVIMVNPFLTNQESISSAGIAYLAAKTLSPKNKDLANLAIIGMVGDSLEKNLGKLYDSILKDSETIVKKGLLIYPATRPLDKALEYASNPYIPGVTGSYKGVMEVLNEAGIPKIGDKYKAIYELTEEEMSRLLTSLTLRCLSENPSANLIGNIFLVKFFNKLEDAREISALINACSRMDRTDISLGFCLGDKNCKEEAEKIYAQYKQALIEALHYVSESTKISGKSYTIIHGKDIIKDTIIGTVASIISNSLSYPEGTIIVALAYNQNKIKVSARTVGKKGRNVREVLAKATIPIGGEVGGHSNAAGCLIDKEKESIFLEHLINLLEVESIKI